MSEQPGDALSEQGPVLPAGVGFLLSVPPGWHELPLDPARRRSGLQELLDRLRDVPALREHRTAVASLVTEQVQRAWASGAAYAASMVEPTEDGPITASVVVQVVPGPLGVPHEEVLDALADPLPPLPPSTDDAPWRETTRVEVPTRDGGTVTAVRAVGVEDVDLPDERPGQGGGVVGTVRLVLLQLLVPLPRGRALVVTCSSPALPLAEVLLDLFDAVAGTLELQLPEQEEAA